MTPPRLEATRAAFPEWDIYPALGGYVAVPKGTPVCRAMYLESLTEKMRRANEAAREDA